MLIAPCQGETETWAEILLKIDWEFGKSKEWLPTEKNQF